MVKSYGWWGGVGWGGVGGVVAHVIIVSPQVLRLGFGLLDFGLGLDKMLKSPNTLPLPLMGYDECNHCNAMCKNAFKCSAQ